MNYITIRDSWASLELLNQELGEPQPTSRVGAVEESGGRPLGPTGRARVRMGVGHPAS
jgi:hypothetical protein